PVGRRGARLLGRAARALTNSLEHDIRTSSLRLHPGTQARAAARQPPGWLRVDKTNCTHLAIPLTHLRLEALRTRWRGAARRSTLLDSCDFWLAARRSIAATPSALDPRIGVSSGVLAR